MGLDIVLGWPGQTPEDRTALMNGQGFEGKVGYLRSSYDEGGFNRWAACQLGGRDWYWIFDYNAAKVIEKIGVGTELLGFFPDWLGCRQRTEEALKLAQQITDRLFLIPLPKPTGKPENYPDLDHLLEVYRTERAELTRLWEKFTGKGPPLNTANGRFSVNWAKILAVLWTQFQVHHSGAPPTIELQAVQVHHSGAPPTIELQAVLVCEGPPDFHQGYISMLDATLRFIEFGQEKNGWLFWDA